MGLRSTVTNEYMKIKNVKIGKDSLCEFSCSVYPNTAEIVNGKAVIVSGYDNSRTEDFDERKIRNATYNGKAFQTEIDKFSDSEKNITDNILTAGYTAIKKDSVEFSSWENA